jgi:hypothetical protein
MLLQGIVHAELLEVGDVLPRHIVQICDSIAER